MAQQRPVSLASIACDAICEHHSRTGDLRRVLAASYFANANNALLRLAISEFREKRAVRAIDRAASRARLKQI
jgi:hypothetical protein